MQFILSMSNIYSPFVNPNKNKIKNKRSKNLKKNI